MIRRIEHQNGLVTYQSDLLHEAGVRHAFTTRIGGVSSPPYDTLNLGYLTKEIAPDNNTDVAENFRRLRRVVGLERYMRVQVRQVHGAGVYTATVRPQRLRDAPPADAIIGDVRGTMLTIRTADCVPLLLGSRDGRVVAAVHAGWRGIIAGVVDAAIQAMRGRFAVEPSELIAAIGPCIGVEAFEVGEEVAAEFDRAVLAAAVDRKGRARPHINLSAAVAMQLARCGLDEANIEQAGRCTSENREEFFSHRRDRGVTGRMAAVAAVRD